MINIIKTDLKLKRFKSLVASTTAAIVCTTPTIVAFSIPSFEPAPELFSTAFFVIQAAAWALPFVSKNLDSRPMRFMTSKFWKMLLDKPALYLLRKEQDRVIVDLRTLPSEKFVDLYVDMMLHPHLIENFEKNALKNKTSVPFTDYAAIEFEVYPKNFYTAEKAYKELNIRFTNIIESVFNRLAKDDMQSQIVAAVKSRNVELFSVDSEERQQFLLESGYDKLKQCDYSDLTSMFQKDSKKAFKTLTMLYSYKEAVDWVRVRDILNTQYKQQDLMYESHLSIIEGNIKTSDNIKSLDYAPNYYKTEWTEIKSQYDQLKNSGPIPAELNRFLDGALKAVIAADKILANTDNQYSVPTKKLMLDNLLIATATLKEAISSRASSLVKELEISKRHMVQNGL